jgi:formate dehydrogenase assembly factor FdhD
MGVDKVIGIVFAKNAVSAKGALLAVYGRSLYELRQNIIKALCILGICPVGGVVLVPLLMPIIVAVGLMLVSFAIYKRMRIYG